MRSRRTMLAAVAALVTCAGAARAQWPPGGRYLMLANDSFNGLRAVRILDLPSGDLAVVGVGKGGMAFGYSVQRISPQGVIPAGWPADGAFLDQVFGQPTMQAFAVDDTGAVWHEAVGMVSGLSTTPSVEYLLDATRHGPWVAATGTASTNHASDWMGAAAAPGGAYLGWNNRVQRFTRAGVRDPAWPAGGFITNAPGFATSLQPDGAGGVIVLGAAIGGPRLQRVDANAVRHAGWASTGVPLSSDPLESAALADPPLPEALVRSDAAHLFAGWIPDSGSSPVHTAKLQRFDIDGTLDPTWPATGLVVAGADTLSGVTMVSDRAGGVYVLWYAHGAEWANHVQADGRATGAVDLSPATPFRLPGSFLQNPLAYVIADAGPDGGLVYAWNEPYPSQTIHVRWLLADLSANPGEPDRTIVTDRGNASLYAVHADGVGGVYVAWQEDKPPPPGGCFNCDYGEVWMTRLLPSSLAGVAPRPASFALSAPRPNPAPASFAIDLVLADDSPARVELLDVAGRVVRSQPVQGAGSHTVSFGDVRALAPGLYFARATTAAGTRIQRVVIAH